MSRNYPLESRTPFLFEEWTEAYIRYGDRNTAEENGILGRDFLWAISFANWQAERVGVSDEI
jgi:hypothetical protein